MANYSNLINSIKAVIKQNGTNDITGQLMQDVLVALTNSIGRFAAFAGVAIPNTNPNNPDQTVYYLTSTPGTYVNFGGIVVPSDRLVALHNISGAWEMVVVVTFSDGGTISIDPDLDPNSVNPVENRALTGYIVNILSRLTDLERGDSITTQELTGAEVGAIDNTTYDGKKIISFTAVAIGINAWHFTSAQQKSDGIYIYGMKLHTDSTVTYEIKHPNSAQTLQDVIGGADMFQGGFISYY